MCVHTKNNRAEKWKGNKHMEDAPDGQLSKDLQYHLAPVRLSVLLSETVLSHVSKGEGDAKVKGTHTAGGGRKTVTNTWGAI